MYGASILLRYFFVLMGIFPLGAFASQGNDIAYKLALSKELADVGAALEFYQERRIRTHLGRIVHAMRESGLVPYSQRLRILQHMVCPTDCLTRSAIRNDTSVPSEHPSDLGEVEGKITRAYLQYAQMIQFGVVRPGAVDEEIKRKHSKIDQRSYLTNLVAIGCAGVFSAHVYPQSREYARLLQEKERLFGIIARGGWGAPVTGGKLQPGDRGKHVVSLRNRLIAMGYLERTLTVRFDADIQRAVQAFQLDHGMAGDGIVGDGTRAELNKSPEDRLVSDLGCDGT